MHITIIGAGGSVGRAVAQFIVAERFLQCEEKLILVGNPEGKSAKSLYGFGVDLMDAYAEICPQIEVVFRPEEVRGDLIIMAGGFTMPIENLQGEINRDQVAKINLPIFERYGHALKKNGHGHEIVICISNPNELCVAVFAYYLGRKRVIGMGGYLDSMRFRKEIAFDLGVRRQMVHGFMVGEHGANVVPLWSSVHVYGYKPEQLKEIIQKIRKGYKTSNFLNDIHKSSKQLRELVISGKIQKAYSLINQYPPDIRVALKPFVTHFSGSKTVMGTAKTTLELIRTITLGNDALISGQIKLEGDFYDIQSTIGVPFVVGNQGVDRIIEIQMEEEEKSLLCQCAQFVNEKIIALNSRYS